MGEAAELLGMSVSALRRRIDAGTVRSRRSRGGHRVIEGVEVARVAAALAGDPMQEATHSSSARNRFRGIVTAVTKDEVAAKVEIQSGQHRIVSLTTREAVDELGLRPGLVVVASVKATNVVVETWEGRATATRRSQSG